MAIRPFPRPLAYVALSVVALHGVNVVFLGPSTGGSILGNALQIFSSLLAAAMCFRAAERGPGFSRAFWMLVGCGMGMWGLADFGWAYYEIAWHMEPPAGSLIRFLFDTHGMFFVMAVFLNQDKRDSNVDLAELLDFLQIGILFFLIYFGAYYLPAMNLSYMESFAREYRVMTAETLGICLLALAQWKRSATPEARRLFGGLALYYLFYGSLSILVTRMQLIREMPTGTWYDLGWSVPLLCGAFWAASWQPLPESAQQKRLWSRTLGEILINNIMFTFAPMIILIEVAQMGPDQKLIRFTLLSLSFGCYAVRIGLTQFRQHEDEETVRRQTLAMDSSIEGIGILNEKGEHIYANAALVSILGLHSANAILGQHWRVAYALQQASDLEAQVRKLLETTGKWTGNLQLLRPDGRRVPVEMQVSMLPDGGTLCVCRDLSQHQEAEKARADAEAKYRMLVEQVNAITYIAEIGIHGKWFYVSPQVEAILGYTPDEWLAMASTMWDRAYPSGRSADRYGGGRAKREELAVPGGISGAQKRRARSLVKRYSA